MKHHFNTILAGALLALCIGPARGQNVDNLPTILGSAVDKTNDKIMVRDASVSASAGALRQMALAELVNVPGLFSGGAWGSITGTLSAQSDLAAALAGKSSLDTQATEDTVNTQPYTAAKIAGWTPGGGGTAAPVRLLFIGDSLSTAGGGLKSGPLMGRAGIIGLQSYNRTGTVTLHTPPSSGRQDYWISGIAQTYAIGATGEYTDGGISTGDIRGDKCCIGYIKQSGGGSFDLQYQTNGTGAWTTVASINTANATQIGAYAEYSLPTSNSPFYRLRINNVTTGPVVVVVTGIYNSNGGGVISMPNFSQISGLDVSQAITTPSAVFAPIWTGLAPDIVMSLWADTGTEWDSGGAFRTFYAASKTAYGPTDWIQISRNISYEDGATSWSNSTSYASGSLVYVVSSGTVYLYRCSSTHTSASLTEPGVGANWATVWTLESPQAGVEITSKAYATSQAASQRAWALSAGETFINGAELFGSSWGIANTKKLMGDIVHPSTAGSTLRNMHIWSKLPLGSWYLGGGLKLGVNDSELNSSATSGAINAQKIELLRPLAIRSSSGSLSLFDKSSLFDNTRVFQISHDSRAALFSCGSTSLLTVSGAVDGTAGIYPGFTNLPLGSTSLRFSAFASGMNAGIATKTSAYTALSTDHTILCDATTAAFSVTLPSASTSSGRVFVVVKTDSSGNAITIDPNASETINGSTTTTVTTQYQSYQMQCNGTAWFKIN